MAASSCCVALLWLLACVRLKGQRRLGLVLAPRALVALGGRALPSHVMPPPEKADMPRAPVVALASMGPSCLVVWARRWDRSMVDLALVALRRLGG